MLAEKINIFKIYLEKKINKYFPSLQWAALLIVLPAFFIVIIYFFSIITEVAIGEKQDTVVAYENRFAPLNEDLPAHAVVNYISDQKLLKDFIIVRYVLIPARMVRGLKPAQNYLVVHNLDTAKIPEIKGYTMKKDYGNGVMLFRRRR